MDGAVSNNFLCISHVMYKTLWLQNEKTIIKSSMIINEIWNGKWLLSHPSLLSAGHASNKLSYIADGIYINVHCAPQPGLEEQQ